jgi:small subunit ribosomal protein S20
MHMPASHCLSRAGSAIVTDGLRRYRACPCLVKVSERDGYAGRASGELFVPNIKSAIKRVHVTERRHLRNRSAKSAVRTFVKTAEKSIRTAKISEEATIVAVGRALKALDSTASKGIIHKNNAARRKSRLMKKLNQAKQSA